MPSTLIDSGIYKDLFGTAAMRAIFSDEGVIERWLLAEAALARAQAACGLIPEEAAAEITAKAVPEIIDIAAIKSSAENVGRAILPLARQLAAACDGDAGAYVHWGTTTQDIMDTGTVLQIREGLDLIGPDLNRLIGIICNLAHEHRETLMAGRTAGQQALPITFGLKAAVWAAELDRHRQRLIQCRPRVLVGQLGGAVGTLASMGPKGLDVQARFAQELRLGQPDVSWHVARDAFAETCLILSLIIASLGKVAVEINHLAATEVGEVREAFAPGRGGSSTMAHKRNPRFAEFLSGISRLAREKAMSALDAMVTEGERWGPAWMAEWAVIPELFILTAGALDQAIQMLDGLEVDKGRMLQNLNLTDGAIMAESVMMALAPLTGRGDAHDLIYDACRQAEKESKPLLDILAATPEVSGHLSRADLERAMDPAQYLGAALEIVDRTLAGLDFENQT